jgi:outer membrane lipoprotein-sorting protein
MTKRLLVVAVAAIASLPATALAQTADEVIEKSLTAIGGRAALGKLTSRSASGTITIGTPVGDISGTIELYNKPPNKSRTLIKADLTSLGAGQLTQDQRFDGNVAYALDSLQGNRDITGDQLEVMRNATFPTPFVNYKESGTRAELLGKEKVGDKDAYVVRLTPKAGPASRAFFDAESYLPVRTIISLNVPQLGSEIEQTVNFLEYREVDGVKETTKLQSVNQLQSVTIVLTKIEHNVPIDDKMFAKP